MVKYPGLQLASVILSGFFRQTYFQQQTYMGVLGHHPADEQQDHMWGIALITYNAAAGVNDC